MAINIHTRRGHTVRDPYKINERFQRWDRTIKGANPADTKIILTYITDMEDGRNVGGAKRARTPTRLLTIRSYMCTLSRNIQRHYRKTLLTITEEELHKLFKELRTGKITKEKRPGARQGEPYASVRDYAKAFKAFWHWYMRSKRREGVDVRDITLDLDTTREKPRFNYLPHEKVKLLANGAKYDYRVLIWFLFDSGMRPTEMHNVRVCDLELGKDGIFTCNIREETSKTFGRKIKLLLSSSLLKEYLQRFELKREDYLWNNGKSGASQAMTYQYLKRLGQRVLGLKDFSAYDLRHSSACYWLPRYKSESAMKYRFGWEKSEMISYYTEFLGMKDTITQEDMLDSDDKTQLQQEVEEQKRAVALLTERLADQERAIEAIAEQKFLELLQRYKVAVVDKNK